MFYAMAENKIDLRGYRFDHRLEDIQTLNKRARRGELHISAISIHTYPYVADKYALLPCGASMETDTGQSLSKSIQRPTPMNREQASNAQPAFAALRRGRHRTANSEQRTPQRFNTSTLQRLTKPFVTGCAAM